MLVHGASRLIVTLTTACGPEPTLRLLSSMSTLGGRSGRSQVVGRCRLLTRSGLLARFRRNRAAE